MLKQENKYCVYIHINPFTEEVFYVGIGTAKRPKQKYKRSIRWHSYVKKYGFKYKILFEALNWIEACIKEKELIKLYGRLDLKNGPLINMTNGGDGTGGYTGYWKGKKRQKATAETREKCKLNNAKYWAGKKHSEETKKKLRIANLGKKASEETKKKMSEATPWNRGLKGAQPSRKGVKTGKLMHSHTREALIKANTGRKRSEEFKKLMSQVHKGKIVPMDVRKKISETLLRKKYDQ